MISLIVSSSSYSQQIPKSAVATKAVRVVVLFRSPTTHTSAGRSVRLPQKRMGPTEDSETMVSVLELVDRAVQDGGRIHLWRNCFIIRIYNEYNK